MRHPDLPEVSTLTEFPLPESNWLEYKAAASSCMLNKIPATICAMLNSDGGYIVVGVDDNTLSILGMGIKEYDRLALYIDNIYRSGQVLTEDGKTLPLGTLTVYTEMAANTKRLGIIKMEPQADMRYKLKNNEMYYRLSASNFRFTLERQMFTRGELETYATKRAQAFQQTADQHMELSKKLSEDYTNLLKQTKRFEVECQKMSHEMREATSQAKEFREELESTRNWLRNTILKEKEIREKEIYEKNTRFTLWNLLCFL